MADLKDSTTGLIADVSRNLAGVFRHLLPGVLILGAAYSAHPLRFQSIGVDTKSWQHLALGLVIALTAGNVWFALNRYGFHQLIDYFAYLISSPGPTSTKRWAYLETLGKYVKKGQGAADISSRARQQVAFRASSVLLLYTLSEVGLLFWAWHEPGTVFADHPNWILGGSLATFGAGLWQNVITRRIDYEIVEG